MKVYADDKTRERIESSRRFAGNIGSLDAELDDQTIDGLNMREALQRFGEQLIAQMPTSRGRRVVGVELRAITFGLMFDADEEGQTR